MPKEGSRYTSQQKWQEQNGLIAKTYKLRKDLVDKFAEACKEQGATQAATISKFMNEFVDAEAVRRKNHRKEREHDKQRSDCQE